MQDAALGQSAPAGNSNSINNNNDNNSNDNNNKPITATPTTATCPAQKSPLTRIKTSTGPSAEVAIFFSRLVLAPELQSPATHLRSTQVIFRFVVW